MTVSHLRFGREPIKSTYLVTKADFVACHNPAYLGKYDMVHDIKPGGIFLLNCGWSMEELERRFTGDGKAYLAKNNIHLYTIDAGAIGKELDWAAASIPSCRPRSSVLPASSRRRMPSSS